MPPQLLALTEGPSILLDKPILLVGRHEECDIQLPSRKISRRHCCIAQVHDYLVVRDLSSTNGIRINGVRVVEGSLRTGDELTIGNYRYEVSWDGRAIGPAAPPVGREVDNPGRHVPAAADEDPLESCDEPVPLDEPEGLAPPLPGLRPPVRPPDVQPAPARGDIPPMPPGEPPSLILPENLELAPSKDDAPPATPAG
jgi:predicted component of type VI protein secretion system